MADIKQTGYQVAAIAVAWAGGQSLDSATDNEWTDLSDEIDNSANLYTEADMDIALGSAAFTGVDSLIEVYIIASVDGTNYPNWTGNVTTGEQENDQYWIGSVVTSGATSAQRMTLRNLPIPPGKYKYGFRNTSGVTLAGSGNTAQWRPHSIKSV